MRKASVIFLLLVVMATFCGCSMGKSGPEESSLPPLEVDETNNGQSPSEPTGPRIIYTQTMENGLIVDIYDDKRMVLSGADADMDLRDDRVLAGHLAGITTVEFQDGVHTVGKKAFSDNTVIKKVIFGNSVEQIEYSAFSGCTALTDIRFGEHLERIHDYAFSGCTALKDVIFGDAVRILGDYAFEGCSALRNVEFGTGLETAGNHVFSDCKELVSARFQANIPASIFSDCTSLESISMDPSITEVGDRAFSGCTALKNITWSENVKAVHAEAFRGCTSLENLIIPTCMDLVLYESAFSGCTKFVTIDLPEGVIEIKERCFEGCTSLERLTLPKTLKNIGGRFLSNCPAFRDLWYRGTQNEFKKIKKATDWIKGENNVTWATKYKVA